MPRHGRKEEESCRLNLEVAPRVRAQIEGLQKLIHAESLTEVIRRALDAYQVIVEAKKEGKTFLIRDKTGKEKEVVVIVP